jgi:hypothetical protein
MREAITVQNIELKCDACGAIEGKYQLGDIGPHMIGRPCPDCGANLLTKQDLNSMHMVLGMKDLINGLLGPLAERKGPVRHEIISVNPHGDKLTIERRDSHLSTLKGEKGDG